MATDAAVAARIQQLTTAWNESYTGDNAHRAPGRVNLWFPVDSTSCMVVPVSGRVIRFCGITADAIGGSFKQYKPKPRESTSADANRRVGGGTRGRSLDTKLLGQKEIWINLKVPVKYKRKTKEVFLTRINMRVPDLISIDCLNFFLWEMCSADKRPETFETNHKLYYISKIEQAKLGELSDKVESADSSQAAVDTGASLQPSSKVKVPE